MEICDEAMRQKNNAGRLWLCFLFTFPVMNMKNSISIIVEVLRAAIADLKRDVEAETDLPAADIKKANRIVEIAELNIFNLSMAASCGESFYLNRRRRDIVDNLVRDAAAFATSLQAEGYGLRARLANRRGF